MAKLNGILMIGDQDIFISRRSLKNKQWEAEIIKIFVINVINENDLYIICWKNRNLRTNLKFFLYIFINYDHYFLSFFVPHTLSSSTSFWWILEMPPADIVFPPSLSANLNPLNIFYIKYQDEQPMES